jgi:hypothetical protein
MIRRRTTAVLTVIIVIVVIVIFTGCVEDVSTKSPREVVKDFASHHKNGKLDKCYSLMSTEYKNLTDEKVFRDKIKHCNDYYIITVKSEEIDGNMASVEIEYVKEPSYTYIEFFPSGEVRELYDKESKTVYLITEGNEWKLIELYCELKSE